MEHLGVFGLRESDSYLFSVDLNVDEDISDHAACSWHRVMFSSAPCGSICQYAVASSRRTNALAHLVYLSVAQAIVSPTACAGSRIPSRRSRET
jgi:hypothetical protein